MKQSIYLLFFLVLTVPILSFQKCKRDYIEIQPKYEFVEKLTLTPYKKVYAVNDTIWIQFQAANNLLYDKLSNSRVLMDTSSLLPKFLFHKRYVLGTQPEFFCEVKVDSILKPSFSTLYTSYNRLNLKTPCNNPFFFKVGFVLKKTGVFSLEPGLVVEECANKIIRSYFTSKFVFDLLDCNKDIWLSIPEQSRGSTDPNFEPNRINKKEIFVFKVQ